MTNAEAEKYNLISEVVQIRRMIEIEHDEAMKYKKEAESLQKKLDDANRLIRNYKKLFDIKNVEV